MNLGSFLFASHHITSHSQGLTIDSRKSDAAPPRVILGEVVHDVKAYYDNLRNQDRTEL